MSNARNATLPLLSDVWSGACNETSSSRQSLASDVRALRFIRYVNPLPIVGTVPILDGKVLLCRRAIEPRKGFWTLPAGFMEGYETLKEGAARETLEETGEEVKVGELLTIIDVPDANQVHFFFRAELQDINGVPGEETLEQRLFSEEEIPWDMLSFTTVKTTLRHYFEDFHAGKFELHTYKLSK